MYSDYDYSVSLKYLVSMSSCSSDRLQVCLSFMTVQSQYQAYTLRYITYIADPLLLPKEPLGSPRTSVP